MAQRETIWCFHMEPSFGGENGGFDFQRAIRFNELEMLKFFEHEYSDLRLHECQFLTKHLFQSLTKLYEKKKIDKYDLEEYNSFRSHITVIRNFIMSLWDALTSEEIEYGLVRSELNDIERKKVIDNSRVFLWSHYCLGNYKANIPFWLNELPIVKSRPPIYKYEENLYLWLSHRNRSSLFDKNELKKVADTYLGNPWMRSDYLDWVFVDSLIAHELESINKDIEVGLWGESYLYYGDKWESFFSIPYFTAFWITLMIVFADYLYALDGEKNMILEKFIDAHPIPMLPKEIQYILYLFVILLCNYIILLSIHVFGWFSLKYLRLPRSKSVRQKLGIMVDLYSQLEEASIHVPSLLAKADNAIKCGIDLDPQVKCILDNVRKNNPVTWSIPLRDN